MGGRADLTCGTSGIWEGGLTSHVGKWYMGGRADLTCGTSGIWEGGLTSHVGQVVYGREG